MITRKHIANVDEVPKIDAHENFVAFVLGANAGAKELGATLFRIKPNSYGPPYHYHPGDEEAFFITRGDGFIEINNKHHVIREWDFISFLAGTEGGHRIKAGEFGLEYLAISTKNPVEFSVSPRTKNGEVVRYRTPWVRTNTDLSELEE